MTKRPKLSEACRLYCEFLVARGLSEGTVRNNQAAVNRLIEVSGDIQVESLTPRHLERVFTYSPWTESTANVRLGMYRAFFEWCRARRFMTRENDPLLGWRSRRVPDKARTRYPVQSWPKLFESAYTPHERILLATGLYLFLRASEQVAIKLKDVDLQNSSIEIWRRKTKERDTMPVSLELTGHLRDHLTWMASQGFTDPDHYLIPGFAKGYDRDENGQYLPSTGVIDPNKQLTHPHRIVQGVIRRAGLPLLRYEGVHALRRSGARAYFDSLAGMGYDGALRRVQAMLGHKSGVMTEVYLGLDIDRQSRNLDLAGRSMFPEMASANVSQLRRAE